MPKTPHQQLHFTKQILRADRGLLIRAALLLDAAALASAGAEDLQQHGISYPQPKQEDQQGTVHHDSE